MIVNPKRNGVVTIHQNSFHKPLARHREALYIFRSFATKDFTMRRPKGIKTKKAAAKRFKITGTGKVLRAGAGQRHLLESKSPKRRRNARGTTLVSESDVHRVMAALPFSHRG